MRLFGRGTAVVAWLAALWLAVPAHGEGVEPKLDKYGWWNAAQTLPADPSGGLLPPLQVPAPPGAPDDGLYVEAAADGTPLAVAALAFYTGGDVNAALTLALSPGADASGVTLAACPAGGGWDGVQNGPWDQRPTYDPATCTFLGTARGATIVFSIPAAAHEPGSEFLSVAIVPAEGSGAFSVSVKRPTNASLTTTPSPTTAQPAPAPAPAAAGFTPGPVTFGVPDYAAPVDPVTGELVAPTTSTTTPPRVAAPRRVATSKEGSGGRAAAIAVLVLGGAGLWASTLRARRGPRLLGSLAVSDDL